jgi:hypothetical protein
MQQNKGRFFDPDQRKGQSIQANPDKVYKSRSDRTPRRRPVRQDAALTNKKTLYCRCLLLKRATPKICQAPNRRIPAPIHKNRLSHQLPQINYA